MSALRQANHDKLVGLPHVQLITARARFISADTVALSTGQQVQAERIFINTGASPIMPDVAGVDGHRIYDSAGLLSLDVLPSRLVIIGAGFIALEFAFMYARYSSQVTMVSRGDVFLPHEDDDVRALMLQLLAEQGITLRLGEQLQRFDEHDGHTTVITDIWALDADVVLIAIGRRANTAGLGLEHTDVALDEWGYIACNERLRAGHTPGRCGRLGAVYLCVAR